jgi:HSP20 family protein
MSSSCSNQNGTDIRRPIDPSTPPKPEPLIDINRDEKSGELKIIAEVPGFTKENIKVEVVEDALKIQAEREGRRYLKEVPLKAEVDPAHSKVTYRNGVLEARLKVKEFKKVKSEELTIA